MRKFIIAAPLAFAAASVLAAPASASGVSPKAADLPVQLEQLDRQIAQISGGEAARLDREVGLIAKLYNRYERSGSGFNRFELRLLDQRIGQIEQELANAVTAD